MGLGIGIGAYLALIGTSYFCSEMFDKAYDAKLKRLGLISTEPELYGAEKTLQRVMNFIKVAIILAIPLINLVPIFMLFGFESFTDSLISDGKKEGKLRQASDSELESVDNKEGYLQKRIEEIKKFQEQMGKKNIPRTYSELSYDDKIDVLLHELELAYMEKCEAEGIDLSEVPAILKSSSNPDAPKGLKKTL